MIAPSVRVVVDRLLALPRADRAAALAQLTLTDASALAQAVKYEWGLWARQKQLAPEGNWRTFVRLAGRGEGKSRSGSEWMRAMAEHGRRKRVSIIGPTRELVRKVNIEGDSGILEVSPPWFRPVWNATRLELRWPRHPVTGMKMIANVASADDPDRLRGLQHEAVLADEIAAWKKPAEAWAMILMGLRIGENPQACVTTTPRPTAFIKDLIYGPMDETGKRVPSSDTVIVRGTSYDNAANLAPGVLESLTAKYGGTALGRQELEAEILMRPTGALFTDETIDLYRVPEDSPIPGGIKRVIVFVDPSRSKFGTRDMCGIVVVAKGGDGHAYVLKDASLRASPEGWTTAAASVAQVYKADGVFYEKNAVSENIRKVIKSVGDSTETHWDGIQAEGSKRMRAEPVSLLYTKGRVHHVGKFEFLEEEMSSWDPSSSQSPDRMDALVHAVTKLLIEESESGKKFFAVVGGETYE